MGLLWLSQCKPEKMIFSGTKNTKWGWGGGYIILVNSFIYVHSSSTARTVTVCASIMLHYAWVASPYLYVYSSQTDYFKPKCSQKSVAHVCLCKSCHWLPDLFYRLQITQSIICQCWRHTRWTDCRRQVVCVCVCVSKSTTFPVWGVFYTQQLYEN